MSTVAKIRKMKNLRQVGELFFNNNQLPLDGHRKYVACVMFSISWPFYSFFFSVSSVQPD